MSCDRRLHVAGAVDGAARDGRGAALPVPREAEPRQAFVEHGLLEPRLPPRRAAVDGDVDRANRAVAGPREALDLVHSRLDRHAAGRTRDHRLAFHLEAELAPHAVRHRVGIARRLAAEVPGLVADLDAAQPLDADVAFPARNEQPHRIALLGAQHFAVLRVDDQAVVEHLLERHAADVAGAVGAFEHHPFRTGIEPGLVEEPRHGDAGPLRARQQAVRLLHRRRRGLEPVGEAVARALHEIELRHRRIAQQIFHRELERLLHHAVDHEPVLRGIDVRRAVVMPFVDEAVRRDDSVLVLQRRHAPVGKVLPVLEHVGAAPADVRFELRRHAVVGLGNRLAEGLSALGNGERRRRRQRDARGQRAAGERAGAPQEVAAARIIERAVYDIGGGVRRRPRNTTLIDNNTGHLVPFR